MHLLSLKGFAQDDIGPKLPRGKLLIDSSAYRSWQSVSNPIISDNGQYVSYIITNLPVGSWTLVIKSCSGHWENRVLGAKDLIFTNDSRLAIYKMSNDSMFIVELGKSIIARYSSVEFVQVPKKAKHDLIAIFRRNGKSNELILYDCKSRRDDLIPNVSEFILSESGKSLALIQEGKEDSGRTKYLKWIKVEENKIYNIWKGEGFNCMRMDDSGVQLAFMVSDTIENKPNTKCLYYKIGSNSCRLLFDNNSFAGDTIIEINYLTGFNNDGSLLLFNASRKGQPVPDTFRQKVDVKIWSYLDKKLQSLQEKSSVGDFLILYSFDLESQRLNCLSQRGDIFYKQIEHDKGLILHIDPESDMAEQLWNKVAKPRSYLVSAGTGERVPLDNLGSNTGTLSPGEKFVIYTDRKDYFIYDVASGEYRNITKNVKTDWSMYSSGDRDSIPRGVAGWIQNDEAVLIYDRYDIWLLDPKEKKRPINLTDGYGKEQNIVFYIALQKFREAPILKDEKIILNATNLVTKDNGFFFKDLGDDKKPEPLIFGPYVFHLYNNIYANRLGISPIKALNVNKYIVSRMNADESLNFFLTSDFKTFLPLSSIFPEKAYNWYKTELHSWSTDDGRVLQGILYKPENFDSSRKYPLIFNYYEKKTFNLNVCLIPNFSTGTIDIPTYVSNGYLVFTPDFEYEIGDPMKGVYSSVVSAVHYLSHFPYIDISKLGAQGFSMGGVETYYLTANTNIFAAACAASGQSDFISSYGSISKNGYSLQGIYEGGQSRMGGAPWELTEMYIKNSPIFNVDKVTTPLLIMHTTNDEVCPFSQAIEFFTAMRRLRKRVWMLEYTDGYHSVSGRSAKDFTTRMAQFFDHFLKGDPAPEWINRSVSANMQGKND
ncbi:prolyl oligopeptidase family serine peptidase [Chitinophaga sp. W2I13]|uniref:alpha/beta hydrolase family protein n=1 Tax=Chitinophaga sp. W2I13 TaxID=3373923 RepID=UPI003D211C5A